MDRGEGTNHVKKASTLSTWNQDGCVAIVLKYGAHFKDSVPRPSQAPGAILVSPETEVFEIPD